MPYRFVLVAGALALLACTDTEPARTLLVSFSPEPPTTAPAGTTFSGLALKATWKPATPADGVDFILSPSGGGFASPVQATTEKDGVATCSWTLGPLPIVNVLSAGSLSGTLGGHGQIAVTATTDDRLPSALTSHTFGNVQAFLDAAGATGSTEDLAFSPSGTLMMAYAGDTAALFEVHADGSVAAFPTTGAPLQHPLGLAYDQKGVLYVADADAKALLAVVDHTVRVLQDHDDAEAFASPNDVAVGPDGTVYVSDTCTGKVYAVDPASGAIRARVAFDAVTEGGPNGLVVGPDGALWVTTENTAIFCANGAVELTAPVAGLFRIPLYGSAMGAKETIQAGLGVFGDGLAFDAAGNLLVIFDTVDGLALDESIVYVRRAAGGSLVRAFATRGRVYANLAFGTGAFGAKTLYLAMLQIALVPNSPRGLERVDVGVTGAALPPSGPTP